MSIINMPDGTKVLACVKPGQTLTESDKRILAEWVQFCRDRSAKQQRKRNAEMLPGGKHTPDRRDL